MVAGFLQGVVNSDGIKMGQTIPNDQSQNDASLKTSGTALTYDN
jgi:hypothetical protein